MKTDDSRPSREHEVIDFVSSITGSARLRIEENLPYGFVRLKVAEAERRQAQHDIRSIEDIVRELLRNSRDGGAESVFVASQKEQGRYRRLTVIDDGGGIPEGMHQIVFEPRVTSKSEDFEQDRYGIHGRGMALFSIRSRVGDARIVSSVPGKGTAISLTVDTIQVPERSDQATFPIIETVNGMKNVGVGPHNIPRILLEMSIDSPGMKYYIGSFAEVLATMRKLEVGRPEADAAIWECVAAIGDARELAELSALRLGIPVSERNAYRVLNDEVAPLVPVMIMAEQGGGRSEADDRREAPTASRVHHERSPLGRVGKDDLDEIGENTRGVVERVLGRYFLKTTGPARVRKGRSKITISYYVSDEDEEDS